MEYKRRIINFRPICFIGLILIIGILISSLSIFYNVSFSVFLLSFLLAVLVLIIVYSCIDKNYKVIISVILSILILGIGVIGVFNIKSKYERSNLSGAYVISGSVAEIKDKTDLNYLIVVKTNINGKPNKIILEVPITFSIYVGCRVKCGCTIEKINAVEDESVNFYSLINSEYYIASNVKDLKVYNEFDSLASKIKYKIVTSLQTYMPNSYGVSYALLVGDTSYLNEERLLGFRYTGVAHIFAVSGLHVGFLYEFIKLILKLFKVRKKISSFIVIFAIFLYVSFCGYSPSCLRAFFIISTITLSEILDFKNDKISTMFLSSIIVLLINPLYLFDLGFLLSYTAYSSLILLTKPFTRGISKFLPEKVSLYLAPYLSAYIGLLPICLSSFGYYSAFSMLFNMIIVPIISIVYILNVIAIIGVLISSHLAFLCVLPELSFMLITKFITSVNYYAFLLEEIRLGVSVVFYYLTLVFVIDEINITPKIRKNIIFSLLVVFIMSVFVINLRN